MTGPEHYREAERLLAPSTHYYNGGQTRETRQPSPEQVARAQVHATLALAAATIDVAPKVSSNGAAWYESVVQA